MKEEYDFTKDETFDVYTIEELRALYESEREVKEDYKSKLNKAIKYMENYIELEEDNCPVKVEFKEVINILQGVDKE